MSDSTASCTEVKENIDESSNFEMNRQVKKFKGLLQEDKAMPVEDEQPESFSILQLPEDCLLMLFTLMTFRDGFQLGSTCHQLYGLYRDSFKSRQSLVLHKNDYKLSCEVENFYLSSLKKVPSVVDHLKLRRYIPISHIIARFPNLLCLEISNIRNCKRTIPYLVTSLNNSQMAAKLQSLRLDIFFVVHRIQKRPPNLVNWLATEQLQLPSLKHLSLSLFGHKDNYIKCLLNSRLFHSVLPQLTSFHIAANCNLEDVYHFVCEHVCTNAQLMAVAGTKSLQVTLNAIRFYDGEEEEETADNTFNLLKLGELNNQALSCITYLGVSDMYYSPKRTLPLLTNLRKVDINLWDLARDSLTNYPSLLQALATLQYLEDITVSAIGHSATQIGIDFEREDMPVLPSVRIFLLHVETHNHNDPVEFFHLEHCFPKLEQLSVHFEQYYCSFCGYGTDEDTSLNEESEESDCEYCSNNDDTSITQKCGLKLTRGLLRFGTGNGWHSQVKVKDVTLSFNGDSFMGSYESLQNLVAGIKKTY